MKNNEMVKFLAVLCLLNFVPKALYFPLLSNLTHNIKQMTNDEIYWHIYVTYLNTNLNTCPFLNVLEYFKRTYLNALLNCSTLIVANRRKSPMNNRWWSEWCSTRDWHNFQIVGKTYPEDRWTVMVHYTGILPSTCNCDFAKLDTISIGTCILVFVIFFTLKRKDNACKQIQVVVLIKLKKSF